MGNVPAWRVEVNTLFTFVAQVATMRPWPTPLEAERNLRVVRAAGSVVAATNVAVVVAVARARRGLVPPPLRCCVGLRGRGDEAVRLRPSERPQHAQVRPGEVVVASHADPSILHAPGLCERCDEHPIGQAYRKLWGTPFDPIEEGR